MTPKEALTQRLKANFALLSLASAEESRAILTIVGAAVDTKRRVFVWSITENLRELLSDGTYQPVNGAGEIDPSQFPRALSGAFGVPDKSIVIALDFDPYLKNPVVTRALRDCLSSARGQFRTGIFLGPVLKLPAELAHEVAQLDLPLPDSDEIQKIVDATVEAHKDAKKPIPAPEGDKLQRVLEASRGLTSTQIEDAIMLSIVGTKSIEARVLSEEKARAVKAAGALEVLDAPKGGLTDVGGLDAAKAWVRTRGRAFSPEAKAYGLPNPKGCLIVGVQGCGKSLTAKAAAGDLGLPLIRFDVAAVFAGLVGESESNVRTALKTLDAIAPCVVLIDELEKAFSGSGAGKSNDSGTSSRVLGTFLTWTQEHTSPVFLVATANDVTALPPELLRRGRWDAMLFADLPDAGERAEIFRIHLAKRGRDVKGFALAELADACEGFSGAEIEQCVVDALFEGFADGARPIETNDIRKAILGTVPLSRTMSEQIGGLREWAKTRCVPASGSKVERKTAVKVGRAVAH